MSNACQPAASAQTSTASPKTTAIAPKAARLPCRAIIARRRSSSASKASLRRLMLRTARPPLASGKSKLAGQPAAVRQRSPAPSAKSQAAPPSTWMEDPSAARLPTALSSAFIEPAISVAETETTLLASSVNYGAATGTTTEARSENSGCCMRIGLHCPGFLALREISVISR